MAGYDFKYFAKEFANRTESNYNNIYKQYQNNRNNPCVFEVNALITSLYGIVVLPTEMYKDLFRHPQEEVLTEVKNQYGESYIKLCEIIKNLSDANNLRTTYKADGVCPNPLRFIYHLRNSLCHSGNKGINFIPVPTADTSELNDNSFITHVYFHDENTYNKSEEFCAKISIEQLIEIKNCIYKIIHCEYFYENQNRDSVVTIKDYDEFLSKGNKKQISNL